jgi:hypothetical protein
MTQMNQFIARENIKRFEAQLLECGEGTRRDTICQLLKAEKLSLRDGHSGQ